MTNNEDKNIGIIVKNMDYKDDSKIIFIITNEGLISLIARGANKLKSKNNSKGKFITTAKIIHNYNNIKVNIDIYTKILIILEMSYVLAPHITDYELFFRFLSDILDLINNYKYSDLINLYVLTFRIKLLYLLGVAPILSKCVSCGRKENLIGFSLDNGGMLCLNCASDLNKINHSNYIQLFRILYLTKLGKLNDEYLIELNKSYNEEDIENIDKLINSYYESYLGFKSKSKEILNKI